MTRHNFPTKGFRNAHTRRRLASDQGGATSLADIIGSASDRHSA